MRHLRYGILCCILTLISAGAAFAVPFPATDTPGPDQVATVGVTGDYASLEQAAAAFSAMRLTGGMARNWTIEILNSLNEAGNSAFGCATNGFTLTIRPAAGTTPTITFLRTTDNAGPSGYCLIGVSDLLAGWQLVKTDGVIVDGDAPGGLPNQRDLTLTNTAAVAHSFSSPLGVVGDSDNVVFRNLNLINVAPGSLASTSALNIRTRNQSATNFIPDGTIVENCLLDASANTQGHGINMTNSGTITAGIAPTNYIIRNNTINARLRGMFLNIAGAPCSIEANTINIGVGGPLAGFSNYGIFCNSMNGVAGPVYIARNRIDVTSANVSVNLGPHGIAWQTAAAGTVVTAVNNMITTSLTGAPNAINVFSRGIHVTSGVALNAYFNSIFIPDNAGYTGTGMTPTFVYGIGGFAADAPAVTLRNNIISVAEGNGACISYRRNNFAVLSSAANVLYNGGTTVIGSLGATTPTDYATLALWQAVDAGKDNSGPNTLTVVQDPFVLAPGPGVWTSATDLHFTGNPGVNDTWGGIPIAGITTDIDGDARSGLRPYKGCDEIPGSPVPVELSVFSTN